MKINNFEANKKVFVVAEIGNNHEGNFSVAQELIVKAAEAGADAVKDHNVNLQANDGNGGIAYQTFTISVKGKPSLAVPAATSITSSGVILNGDVTSDGNTEITERGFVYSFYDEGSFISKQIRVKQTGTFTSGTFSETITGL